MTLVSKENHICPSCSKLWKCKNEHELTSEYMCSKCSNLAEYHKPITEFGEGKQV